MSAVAGGIISGFFAIVLIGSFVYRFFWYPRHPLGVPKEDEVEDFAAGRAESDEAITPGPCALGNGRWGRLKHRDVPSRLL